MTSAKVFPKCLRELSFDQFYKNKTRREGLAHWCKDCAGEYAVRWKADHPEKNHAYQIKWRAENPARSNEIKAKWHDANLDKVREHTAQWGVANPERRRASVRKRRALIRGASVDLIPTDIETQLIALYGPTCMKPGCENTDLQLDHIVPLSKGGAHAVDNFQLLCGWCNRSKGNRSNTDYRPTTNQPRGSA